MKDWEKCTVKIRYEQQQVVKRCENSEQEGEWRDVVFKIPTTNKFQIIHQSKILAFGFLWFLSRMLFRSKAKTFQYKHQTKMKIIINLHVFFNIQHQPTKSKHYWHISYSKNPISIADLYKNNVITLHEVRKVNTWHW